MNIGSLSKKQKPCLWRLIRVQGDYVNEEIQRKVKLPQEYTVAIGKSFAEMIP